MLRRKKFILTHRLNIIVRYFHLKISFRNDRIDLLAEVKEYRSELEKNRQLLRQAILEFLKVMG